MIMPSTNIVSHLIHFIHHIVPFPDTTIRRRRNSIHCRRHKLSIRACITIQSDKSQTDSNSEYLNPLDRKNFPTMPERTEKGRKTSRLMIGRRLMKPRCDWLKGATWPKVDLASEWNRLFMLRFRGAKYSEVLESIRLKSSIWAMCFAKKLA